MKLHFSNSEPSNHVNMLGSGAVRVSNNTLTGSNVLSYEDFINDYSFVYSNSSEGCVNTLRSIADDISTISNITITGRNVSENFIIDDSIVSSNSSEDYVNAYDDIPNITLTGRNVSENFIMDDSIVSSNSSEDYVNMLHCSADDIPNITTTGRNVFFVLKSVLLTIV